MENDKRPVSLFFLSGQDHHRTDATGIVTFTELTNELWKEMATRLITNIKLLVNAGEQLQLLRGRALAVLPCIEKAWLIIEDGIIAGYGKMEAIGDTLHKHADKIDASGQFVLPCWCDSHTHLVFAASREEEFIDKISGLSYADIAAKGGGILNSARKLNETSEDKLFNDAWKRLDEVSKLGTGAIEIKSGYGLSAEGELKMLPERSPPAN